MQAIKTKKHPDGEGGYIVYLDGTPIGAIWWSRLTRRWYVNPDYRQTQCDPDFVPSGSKDEGVASLVERYTLYGQFSED